MSSLSFEEINTVLLDRYPVLLESWLPGGRLNGQEYECADANGGSGKSFKVNIESGVWKEFNGNEGGSDPVSLYACLQGLGQGEAARELTQELGLNGSFSSRRPGSNGKRKKQVWRPVVPVPGDAPQPPKEHFRLGRASRAWPYHDVSGNLMGYAVRFDSESGKDVLPLTFCQDENGNREWRYKAFEVRRPLYGLDRLNRSGPDAPILICEGEKATDAAQDMAEGKLACLSWPGGCKAVKKADWSLMKGRRVCIWPDADKAGFEAALDLLEELIAVGASSTSLVLPTEDMPEGWDLADAGAWTSPCLFNEIKQLKVEPKEFQKAALQRYGIESRKADLIPQRRAEPEYPDPVSLDDVVLPELKAEMIPGPLANFCQAVAESIQAPLELVVSTALASVAASVQGKAHVLIKPGYIEPLNIFQCCALPPGERKSAVVEICKRPLVRWEAERRAEMVDTLRDVKSERLTLEQAITHKRSKAAKAKDQDARRKMIEEIQEMERELPEIPSIPRLLADDVTPEALAAIMEPQAGRIAIIEAEGGILDTLGGRYSKGVANLDLVLKAWDQEAVHVDRRGREPIVLENPTLTLALFPQPSVIAGMREHGAFRGRGLVGRFLFWLPKSLLGSRQIETQPISPSVETEYGRMLDRILGLPFSMDGQGNDCPHVIRLDGEALGVHNKFAAAVERELGPGGEFEHMTDWAGKLSGQAVRIAGLFHCTMQEKPQEQAIDARTMQAATDMASILIEHAKAALNLMGADPGLECAKAIWSWITRDEVEQFTARDALERIKGRFPTMKEVSLGLDVLMDYALAIELESENRPGRPSRRFIVNPKTRRG